jgi:hypothetical protein
MKAETQVGLAVAADQRHAKSTEAMAIWGKDGESMGALINQLSTKESDVLREASKQILVLRPGLGEPDPPNKDILYAPIEASSHDQFADDYEALMQQVADLLKMKIQISE